MVVGPSLMKIRDRHVQAEAVTYVWFLNRNDQKQSCFRRRVSVKGLCHKHQDFVVQYHVHDQEDVVRRFQRNTRANVGRIAGKMHRSHAVNDRLRKRQVSSTSASVLAYQPCDYVAEVERILERVKVLACGTSFVLC